MIVLEDVRVLGGRYAIEQLHEALVHRVRWDVFEMPLLPTGACRLLVASALPLVVLHASHVGMQMIQNKTRRRTSILLFSLLAVS